MTTASGQPRQVGRYVLFEPLASGGMATVHYGRLVGPAGFARTVAIKRLHAAFATDPDFVSMFLDEARIAARVSHPNVVSTLDVVTTDGEVLLVMEYVQGDSLSQLLRALRARNEAVPPSIAASIACQALLGLHAVHEARGEDGALLGVVHRDVSPQNVLVGLDGVARVADFGIAKAAGRLQTTRDGQIKGKSAYMAPEQIRGGALDRTADIFSASVVLWEALTGQRLFSGDTPIGTMREVLEKTIPAPSASGPAVPSALDDVVARGLKRNPAERFATAHEMAVAIEHAVPLASARAVGEWVGSVASSTLEARARRVAEIERGSTLEVPVPSPAQASAEPSAENVATGINPVTVATGSTRARPRRGMTALVVGALAAVLLAAALPRVMHLGETRPSEPAASGVAIPPPPDPLVLAVPSAVEPTDSSSAAPDISVVQAPQPPAASKPFHAPRPAPHAGHTINCNPPYTTDASGVRHWKDGC